MKNGALPHSLWVVPVGGPDPPVLENFLLGIFKLPMLTLIVSGLFKLSNPYCVSYGISFFLRKWNDPKG